MAGLMMAGPSESTLAEIPWGRVGAVAGGVVVVYGLVLGAGRVLRIAANEVLYRHGGDGAWGQSTRRR